MADHTENAIMHFGTTGEVEYASTLKEINSIMTTAGKVYRSHVAAMGDDATAADKLTAQQQKLQTQLEAAGKRSQMYAKELAEMEKAGNTTGAEYTKLVGKLADSERVESSLQKQMDGVNSELAKQGTDSEKAKSSLDALQQEGNQLNQRQKELTSSAKLENAQLQANGTEAQQLAAKQRQLESQLKLSKDSVANLESQLKATKTAYGENSTEASQMSIKLTDAKTSVVNLESQLDKLGTSTGSANDKLDQIAKNTAADRFQAMGDGLQSAGQKLTEFNEKAQDAWAETDDAVDNLTSKTGATGKAATELGEAFEKAERSTAGAQMESQDLSNTMAGLKSQFDLQGSSLEKTTEYVAKFSAVTGQTGTDAVNALHTSMSKFNVSAQQIPSVLDALAKGAQTSGMNVDDLETAVGDAYPVFSQLHIGLNQGIGIISSWAKGGVDATTALKGMSKASTVYAAQNVSLKDGITKTFNAIKDAKTPTDALNAGVEAFGTRSAPKMVAAIQSGKISLDSLKKSAGDSGGTVAKSFEQTLDPVDKAKVAQKEYQQTLAKVGGVIQETLLPVIKSLLPIVSGLAKAFQAAPAPVKAIVVVIGALVVGLGALSPIITALATALPLFGAGAGTASIGFGALSTSLIPIIAVIAAIVAAIAVVVLAIKNWGAIVDWLKTVWGGIKDFFSNLWNGVKEIFSVVVAAIIADVQSKWDAIVNVTTAVWNGIKSFFTGLWDGIKAIFTVVVQAIIDYVTAEWNMIKLVTSTVFNAISAVVSAVWNAIKLMFTTVVTAIVNVVTSAWNGIKTVTTTIFDGIKAVAVAIWQGLSSVITSAVNVIKSVVSAGWNIIKSATSTIFNTVMTITTSAWNSIKNLISSVVNAVKSVITGAWNAIKSTTSSVWNGVKSAISSVWNAIKSIVSGAANAIRSTVSGVWNGIKSVTSSVWGGIKSAITGPMNAAKSAVGSIISGIKRLFSFKISWPHIPLPHFSLSGKFNPLKGQIPHVAVDWYAQGGIMTQPTMMGWNNGRAQVGGEAGPEGVIPLNDDTWNAMGSAIAAHMGNGQPIVLQVDGRTFATIAGPYISDYMQQQDATAKFSYGAR